LAAASLGPNTVSTVPCVMSVGVVTRSRRPGGVRSTNHCRLGALTAPPRLSRQAVFSCDAARSSRAAAGPSRLAGTPLAAPLPQISTGNAVFIAVSGKKPVPSEFHVESGTIASMRPSIAAVANWIAPP
jgi:hypothetical protein